MNYFKILSIDHNLLEQEIAKGTIFYKDYTFGHVQWIPCGEYRKDGHSLDSMSREEVLMMILRDKNVYWRN